MKVDKMETMEVKNKIGNEDFIPGIGVFPRGVIKTVSKELGEDLVTNRGYEEVHEKKKDKPKEGKVKEK
jgi:hypothetical protein